MHPRRLPAPPLAAQEGLVCKGQLTLTVHDAATGLVVARRRADNLIVTTGIALLAAALNSALVYSENVSWGSPYSNAVGAMYGVVGTSNTPASAGQTKLVAEVGRALVSNAGVTAGVLAYDFFFPTSLGNGVLQEVGAVGAANLVTPNLTAALTSGVSYTTLAVAQVTQAIPSGASLTIGYGSGTTQLVTTSAPTSIGAASISVTSFSAAAAFPAGTLVGYVPGTLIDRAVLGAPVTKAASQTMTLNLSLTLTSA